MPSQIMPTNPPQPDEATVRGWLSGELAGDAALAVEQALGARAGECEAQMEADLIAPELLRDLRSVRQAREEAAALIAQMRSDESGSEASSPAGDELATILEPAETPGTLGRLGHYEVLEVIARGGMGILLRARDPGLDRLAALKVLAPSLASNATARERFLREARAAAALEHENILPIYGTYSEPVPWFAMRYVAGGSLQEALDQAGIRPAAARLASRGRSPRRSRSRTRRASCTATSNRRISCATGARSPSGCATSASPGRRTIPR
ncbi:MAG: protein kinase [Verrucomicrobiales bacterium]